MIKTKTKDRVKNNLVSTENDVLCSQVKIRIYQPGNPDEWAFTVPQCSHSNKTQTWTDAVIGNMPAKKKQSKISKAEKARLKKEEEERRLKEEEEARLIAEKEDQERLEREQREEEERLRLELKDRERREDELNELRHILERNLKKVNMWKDAVREKVEWERYMICDGSPNPAVQPELNTFITLWKEDPEVDIQVVLEQCALALRLTEDLELLLSIVTEPEVIKVYQDILQSLQSLMHTKHQMAAEEILRSAKKCADIDTGNMQMIKRDDNITLCLWANLNKNPRFKGFHFEEVGMSFELPKQLALSDISVRILHTRYDHLSHLSLRTQTQNKRRAAAEEAEEAEAAAKALIEMKDREVEDEELKKEDDGGESAQQEKEDLQSQKSSEGKKRRVSVRSAKKRKQRSSMKKELGDHSESHLEGVISSEEAEDLAVEEPSAESYIVDLHQYTPLGGVYYFDVFRLTPQSLTINGWDLTEILDTGLQDFPYPSEQPQSSESDKQEDTSTYSSPPVGVTVVLPESVNFIQEPQVARWDPVEQHWRTDCITETSYNSETRSISIKMDSFYAFTLLQETHLHMPFQSWELLPRGLNSATLTITTPFTQVSISVQGNLCMLHMDQTPGLNHVLDKWMSLPVLQIAMRRAGVNIFVNEYSDKYVAVSAKDLLVEHAVYEQMALVSSTFAFSRSQWNAKCGQEHIVFQACEHPEEGPVPEEAWSLYLLGAQRSQRLKMTETSDTFSPELAENSEFHSTFLHMLRDVVSPTGKARLDHDHYLLADTVQTLLCSTRLLTFS
ncbi:hypothetical protein HF521_007600 [Silurus meridionalis]|uniref:Dynein axonemal intermediate chain 7 n=2 Tax=Silurus meridionalis TaxID=175797 RepID=A0A8T0AP91_SILME|nr:hypothetical protein HF521_007600 [Silurus meridionalis]